MRALLWHIYLTKNSFLSFEKIEIKRSYQEVWNIFNALYLENMLRCKGSTGNQYKLNKQTKSLVWNDKLQSANYTYFSSPTNALGSMLLILFSYSVRISKVSRPWKAFSCKLLTLLWFIFKIRSWFKFLNAADGTWVRLFWDTSSCVNTLPAKK